MSSSLFLTIAAGTLLSLSSGIHAAQLSVADVTTSPGATVTVSIRLVSQGASISGIQFDLEWDGRAMIVAPLPGTGMRIANKDLHTTSLGADRHRPHADPALPSPALFRKSRLMIVGVNQNVIPDDELLRLFVVVAPKTSPGGYNLRLSNIIATTPDGHMVQVTTATPTITVQNTGARNIAPQHPK